MVELKAIPNPGLWLAHRNAAIEAPSRLLKKSVATQDSA